jgi:peptide/nickel transport system substrate-binding protein
MKMKRSIVAIIGLVILTTMMLQGTIMIARAVDPYPPNPPNGDRSMQLYEATIDGGSPESVDPAWIYDTASAEMVQNVYDTLIMYDGEHMETYLPSIAGSYQLELINQISPEGLTWKYRYVFTLRNWANMTFQPPYNYPVTAADVEYSFERELVQDRASGPQWMLYEPLLNNAGGAGALGTGNLTDEANVNNVGKMLDHAVEQNGTHVWFNIAFPGAYEPFLQILCSSWSSIMSKQWINNYVIGNRTLADWSGNWTKTAPGMTLNHTEWIAYHDPAVSPLDVGGAEGGLMYGSGPFQLTDYNLGQSYWFMERHVNYWRGWPADYPFMANAKPAGYVDEIKNSWQYTWLLRKAMFIAGEVDFCAVPRANIGEVHQVNAPPYKPPNYPLDGIREIQPLTPLTVDGVFFTWDIDPTSTYDNVYTQDGKFDQLGIPHDLFGNATWGVHVRKGFAYAFDSARQLSEAYLGEGVHPATALIPALPYYNGTIPAYTQDLTKAMAEFALVPGLLANGMKISVLFNTGNLARQTAAQIFKDVLQNMTGKFHVEIAGIPWATYLGLGIQHKMGFFIIGWGADFPDAHNFLLPFYHTYGTFSLWQGYSNATMDALINAGIEAAPGAPRQAIYNQVQQLVIDDCPSMSLFTVTGRHYERDWVVGWYFNPIYPGNYFYNMWKWYYAPQVNFNPPTQPMSFYLPADVNYDGKVNIKDVSTAAKSFGDNAGPPLGPRWVFRVDVNNDRKIDIKDISFVAKYFGPTEYAVWVPS